MKTLAAIALLPANLETFKELATWLHSNPWVQHGPIDGRDAELEQFIALSVKLEPALSGLDRDQAAELNHYIDSLHQWERYPEPSIKERCVACFAKRKRSRKEK